MATNHRRPLSSLENILQQSASNDIGTQKSRDKHLNRSADFLHLTLSKYDQLLSIVNNHVSDPIIARQANEIICELQNGWISLNRSIGNTETSSIPGNDNQASELDAFTVHFATEQPDFGINQATKDGSPTLKATHLSASKREVSPDPEIILHLPVDILPPVLRRSNRRASMSTITILDSLQVDNEISNRKPRQCRTRKHSGIENRLPEVLIVADMIAVTKVTGVAETTYYSPQKSPKYHGAASPCRTDYEMPWISGVYDSISTAIKFEDSGTGSSCCVHSNSESLSNFSSESQNSDTSYININTSSGDIESYCSGDRQKNLTMADRSISTVASTRPQINLETMEENSIVPLLPGDSLINNSLDDVPMSHDSSFEFPKLLSALSETLITFNTEEKYVIGNDKYVHGLDDSYALWFNGSEKESSTSNSNPKNDVALDDMTIFSNNNSFGSEILDIDFDSINSYKTCQLTGVNMDQNISSSSLLSLGIDNQLKEPHMNMITMNDSSSIMRTDINIILTSCRKERLKKNLGTFPSSNGRRSSMRFKIREDKLEQRTTDFPTEEEPNNLRDYSYEAPERITNVEIKEKRKNILELNAIFFDETETPELPSKENIYPTVSIIQNNESEVELLSLSDNSNDEMKAYESSSFQINTIPGVDSSTVVPSCDIDMIMAKNELCEGYVDTISSKLFTTNASEHESVFFHFENIPNIIDPENSPLSVISKAVTTADEVQQIKIYGENNDQIRYQELLQWCCGTDTSQSVIVEDPSSFYLDPLHQDNFQYLCQEDLNSEEMSSSRIFQGQDLDGDDILMNLGRFYSDEDINCFPNSGPQSAENRMSLDSCSSAETVLCTRTAAHSISTPSITPPLQSVSPFLLLDLEGLDVCDPSYTRIPTFDFTHSFETTTEISAEAAVHDLLETANVVNVVTTEIEQPCHKLEEAFTLLQRSTTVHALQYCYNLISENPTSDRNCISASTVSSYSLSSGAGFVTVLLSLLITYHSSSSSCQHLEKSFLTSNSLQAEYQLQHLLPVITAFAALVPHLCSSEDDTIMNKDNSILDQFGKKKKKVHFCNIDGSSVITPSHGVSCDQALQTTRRLHSLIVGIDALITSIILIDKNHGKYEDKIERINSEEKEMLSSSLLDTIIYCCELLTYSDSATVAIDAIQLSLSLDINPSDILVIADMILSELQSSRKVPNRDVVYNQAVSHTSLGCVRTALRHRTGWMATSVIRGQIRWMFDPPPTMLTAKTGKIFSPSPLRACNIYKMVTMNEVPKSTIINKRSFKLDAVITSKMTLSSLITHAMKQIYNAFISYYSCHIIPIIGSVEVYVTQLLISSLSACVSTDIVDRLSLICSLEGEENDGVCAASSFYLEGMESTQPQVILLF